MRNNNCANHIRGLKNNTIHYGKKRLNEWNFFVVWDLMCINLWILAAVLLLSCCVHVDIEMLIAMLCSCIKMLCCVDVLRCYAVSMNDIARCISIITYACAVLLVCWCCDAGINSILPNRYPDLFHYKYTGNPYIYKRITTRQFRIISARCYLPGPTPQASSTWQWSPSAAL